MYFSQFYSLNDPVEIKLAILYAAAKIDAPIRLNELIQIIIEATNVNYFNLKVQINALVETDDLAQTEENGQITVSITENGHESVKYLSNKIPYSVKTHITESISSFRVRKKIENEITAEIFPVNVDEYLIKCNVQYGNIPMLKFELYAGSRDYAEKLVKHFKRHASEIYSDVMNDIVRNRDTEEDETDDKKED